MQVLKSMSSISTLTSERSTVRMNTTKSLTCTGIGRTGTCSGTSTCVVKQKINSFNRKQNARKQKLKKKDSFSIFIY